MYYGAYTSKHSSVKPFAETLLAIKQHGEKTLKRQEMAKQQEMEQ